MIKARINAYLHILPKKYTVIAVYCMSKICFTFSTIIFKWINFTVYLIICLRPRQHFQRWLYL